MCVCAAKASWECLHDLFREKREEEQEKKEWTESPFYCQGEFWQDKLRTHSSLATVKSSLWPKQSCSQCYTHTSKRSYTFKLPTCLKHSHQSTLTMVMVGGINGSGSLTQSLQVQSHLSVTHWSVNEIPVQIDHNCAWSKTLTPGVSKTKTRIP